MDARSPANLVTLRSQQLLAAALMRAAAQITQDDLDGYAARYAAAVEDLKTNTTTNKE